MYTYKNNALNFNFSSEDQTFAYPYRAGSDLLTGGSVSRSQSLRLRPWDVMIIAET